MCEDSTNELAAISKLEGWEDWMKHWVYYDEHDGYYRAYEPDHDLLCKTRYPRLIIKSFKHSTFGNEALGSNMQVKRTRQVPAHTEEYTSHLVCDLCKSESGSRSNWTSEYYGVGETTISLKEGVRYPDSTDIETTEYHICPKCFKEKLIPWMESIGAKPTSSEYFN